MQKLMVFSVLVLFDTLALWTALLVAHTLRLFLEQIPLLAGYKEDVG